MKIGLNCIIISAILNLSSCSVDNGSSEIDNSQKPVPQNSKAIYSDTVLLDGEKYPTVKIGSQIWFARNVNTETSYGSFCYNDSIENCRKFGRLYNWSVAIKLCPENWHLPSDEDWNILANYIGGAKTSAAKLMAKTEGWSHGNGTDDYGFAALPSGQRYFKGTYMTGTGYFWSASKETVYGLTYECIWGVGGYPDEFMHLQYSGEAWAFAVRCVKD